MTSSTNPMTTADDPACERCGDTYEVEEATELCAQCYHDAFGTWPEEDEAEGLKAAARFA